MHNPIFLQKRKKFHSQIRSQFLTDYMKKIRYQFHQNQVHSIVTQVISQSQTSITKQQLQTLVDWANLQQQNNAIIHLGNLLIDQTIEPQLLVSQFQIRPKDSEYWPWLIRIMFQLGQQSDKLFQYILNKILCVIPVFALIQCLQILKKFLNQAKQPTITLLFSKYQGIFLKLKQTCLNSDKFISELSYQILDTLIELGEDVTLELLNICSLEDMQRLIIIGFNKIDSTQKKFPLIICRIINNIFSTKIFLGLDSLKACLDVSTRQSNIDKVKIEVSYMWLSLMQNCNSEIVLMVFELKLLNVFEFLLTCEYKKEQNKQKVRQNIGETLELMLLKGQSLHKQVYALLKTSIQILNMRFKSYEVSIQSENDKSRYKQYHYQFEKQTDTERKVEDKEQEEEMDLEQ